MTTITWAEFPKIEDRKEGCNRGYEFEVVFDSNYAKKNKRLGRITQNVIKIGAITGIILVGMEMDVSAAGMGIDEKAKQLFDKFLWIAKWVIALKGGVDTLNKALKEDFEGAKRSAIQYLLVYGIIIALPIGLDFVETFFEGY